MTVTFRNVDASPTDDVRTWPYEAIVIVLERGLVADWQPLIDEVRVRPHGDVARALESYVSYTEPSGITRLCELVIASARTDLDARDRREVADRVQRAIALSGVSAREFAATLGTSASRLSTYANGKVVPSAALLMRMEREAATPDGQSLPRGRRRTP